MQNIIINFEGNTYYFEKIDKSESYNLFLERCWYIVKKKPNNDKEFKYYNDLSKIWCNINFLGVDYDDSLKSLI